MAAKYRRLRLTSPYTKGQDVRRLQNACNVLAKHRDIPQVKADAEYGPDTQNLARQIAWLLGLHKKHLEHDLSVWTQRAIVHPRLIPAGLRTPNMNRRAKKRWARYKKSHSVDAKIRAVLDWCRSQINQTESPPFSNRGTRISVWQREFGMDGQPWCGAFVGYALQHLAALPIPNGIVYTPNIIGYGISRTGGMKGRYRWAEREPGDLIVYKFPGVSNDAADHVGILDYDREHIYTIEGNTSSGNSGSQNNGGGVYRRNRGSIYVAAVVRPRYA